MYFVIFFLMWERLWLFLAVVWQTVKSSFIWNTSCLDYFLCISSLPLKLIWLLIDLLTGEETDIEKQESSVWSCLPISCVERIYSSMSAYGHWPLALESNVSPGSMHGTWKPLRQPHSLVSFWSWECYRVKLSLCLSLSFSLSQVGS